MIFVRGDDYTWLEASWDDEMTAQNPDGWKAEVDRVRAVADKEGYEMRICSTTISGVFELFEPPEVSSSPLEETSGGPMPEYPPRADS